MIRTLSDEKTIELLRDAMPVTADDSPATDLWPLVRGRMTEPPSQGRTADWILAIALAMLCLIRPPLAGILLVIF
jgi:hypothetical protein